MPNAETEETVDFLPPLPNLQEMSREDLLALHTEMLQQSHRVYAELMSRYDPNRVYHLN